MSTPTDDQFISKAPKSRHRNRATGEPLTARNRSHTEGSTVEQAQLQVEYTLSETTISLFETLEQIFSSNSDDESDNIIDYNDGEEENNKNTATITNGDKTVSIISEKKVKKFDYGQLQKKRSKSRIRLINGSTENASVKIENKLNKYVTAQKEKELGEKIFGAQLDDILSVMFDKEEQTMMVRTKPCQILQVIRVFCKCTKYQVNHVGIPNFPDYLVYLSKQALPQTKIQELYVIIGQRVNQMPQLINHPSSTSHHHHHHHHQHQFHSHRDIPPSRRKASFGALPESSSVSSSHHTPLPYHDDSSDTTTTATATTPAIAIPGSNPANAAKRKAKRSASGLRYFFKTDRDSPNHSSSVNLIHPHHSSSASASASVSSTLSQQPSHQPRVDPLEMPKVKASYSRSLGSDRSFKPLSASNKYTEAQSPKSTHGTSSANLSPVIHHNHHSTTPEPARENIPHLAYLRDNSERTKSSVELASPKRNKLFKLSPRRIASSSKLESNNNIILYPSPLVIAEAAAILQPLFETTDPPPLVSWEMVDPYLDLDDDDPLLPLLPSFPLSPPPPSSSPPPTPTSTTTTSTSTSMGNSSSSNTVTTTTTTTTIIPSIKINNNNKHYENTTHNHNHNHNRKKPENQIADSTEIDLPQGRPLLKLDLIVRLHDYKYEAGDYLLHLYKQATSTTTTTTTTSHAGDNEDAEACKNLALEFSYPDLSSYLTIDGSLVDEPIFETSFYKKNHYNYVSNDRNNVVVVSIACANEKSPKKILIQTPMGSVQMRAAAEHKFKEILKAVNIQLGENHTFVRVKDTGLENQLLKYEHGNRVRDYKFGILYCKDGQLLENDMFSNKEESPELRNFLELIANTIPLKGWKKFRGGLDVNENTTGTHSIFTIHCGYEIMFHVSTMLPFYPADKQQLERKRHLGNDVVLIIFKEGDQLFDPSCIHSEFNHVFIVVQCVSEKEQINNQPTYRVEITYKGDLPRPPLPILPRVNLFNHNDEFRKFLLAKLINSERMAMRSKQFALKLKRTRTFLLQDMYDTFVAKTSK